MSKLSIYAIDPDDVSNAERIILEELEPIEADVWTHALSPNNQLIGVYGAFFEFYEASFKGVFVFQVLFSHGISETETELVISTIERYIEQAFHYQGTLGRGKNKVTFHVEEPKI